MKNYYFLFTLILVSIFGTQLFATEVSFQKDENTVSFRIPVQNEMTGLNESITRLRSDSDYAAKAEKMRRMKLAGIGLTVSGIVLYCVGPVFILAAYGVFFLNVGIATFSYTSLMAMGALGYGLIAAAALGILMASLGGLFFVIGLPFWIIGFALEKRFRRKAGMSMYSDVVNDSFVSGVSIRL